MFSSLLRFSFLPNLSRSFLRSEGRRCFSKLTPFSHLHPLHYSAGTSGFGLFFLGSGGGALDFFRAAPSLALTLEKEVWLFDCGLDTPRRLLSQASKLGERRKISPSKIRCIFITHLHADHIMGLLGTILMIDKSQQDEQRPVLHIYGPLGIRQFVRGNLAISRPALKLKIFIHEIVTDQERENYDLLKKKNNRTPLIKKNFFYSQNQQGENNFFPDDDSFFSLSLPSSWGSNHFVVRAGFIKHTVPCLGFVIEEKEKKSFLEEKAERVGLTNEVREDALREKRFLVRELKDGKSVTLPNGKTILPSDVIVNPRGRKVCILGDTDDASSIIPLARNSDVVVHEGTLLFSNGNTDRRGHSTGFQAGNFAREVNGDCLLLNHICIRDNFAQKEKELMKEAILSYNQRQKGEEEREKRPVVLSYDMMHAEIFHPARSFHEKENYDGNLEKKAIILSHPVLNNCLSAYDFSLKSVSSILSSQDRVGELNW